MTSKLNTTIEEVAKGALKYGAVAAGADLATEHFLNYDLLSAQGVAIAAGIGGIKDGISTLTGANLSVSEGISLITGYTISDLLTALGTLPGAVAGGVVGGVKRGKKKGKDIYNNLKGYKS